MTQEEFDQLVVGSVVLFGPRKRFRVVRRIDIDTRERTKWAGRKFYVYFAIKWCSWTTRCYTLYCRHEIVQSCEFTWAVVDIPQWERGVFAYETSARHEPPRVTCCDVKGYA